MTVPQTGRASARRDSTGARPTMPEQRVADQIRRRAARYRALTRDPDVARDPVACGVYAFYASMWDHMADWIVEGYPPWPL